MLCSLRSFPNNELFQLVTLYTLVGGALTTPDRKYYNAIKTKPYAVNTVIGDIGNAGGSFGDRNKRD